MHDHILCYAKNAKKSKADLRAWELKLIPRGDEVPDGYTNPDNDPRGVWTSVVLSAKSGTDKLKYEITTPSGRKCLPPDGRFWGVSEVRFQELVADGRIWFGKAGNGIPRLKTFLSEVQDGLRPNTIWFHSDVGHNQEGRQELKKLFEDKAYFDSPKPVRLLKSIIDLCHPRDEFTVLDFFAGSATTAHAVLEKNVEDGNDRRFIMVQLPEPCGEKTEAYKAGYKTISEISMDRIKRATEKLRLENPEYDSDLGCKLFKLDSSNIRRWDPDRSDLEETLLSHKEHLVEGRTEQDVLYELLLKRGIELTVPIEERKAAGKTIYSIGYGVLFACLDTSIAATDVDDVAQGILDWHKELAPETDTHVFFRDSAFADDIAKTNMAAILEQNGISHVRSL